MTTILKLAKPSLMMFDSNKITDHNRADVEITVNRIMEANRMANGTMRRYVVADKRTFSTSWENLPHAAQFTVDGFWGKREMENWYNTVPGPFTLTLHHGDGVVETFLVNMTKFEASISKRGSYDFWKVDVEMEEV